MRAMPTIPVGEHRRSCLCSFCEEGEMETIRVGRRGRRRSRRTRCTNVGCEAHFSHIKPDRDVGAVAKHIARVGAAQHRGPERLLDSKEPPKGRNAQAKDTTEQRLYTANSNRNRRREHRRALGLLKVQWAFCEATTCREGFLNGLINPFCSGCWHQARRPFKRKRRRREPQQAGPERTGRQKGEGKRGSRRLT
jgi:hypothetical protein